MGQGTQWCANDSMKAFAAERARSWCTFVSDAAAAAAVAAAAAAPPLRFWLSPIYY